MQGENGKDKAFYTGKVELAHEGKMLMIGSNSSNNMVL